MAAVNRHAHPPPHSPDAVSERSSRSHPPPPPTPRACAKFRRLQLKFPTVKRVGRQGWAARPGGARARGLLSLILAREVAFWTHPTTRIRVSPHSIRANPCRGRIMSKAGTIPSKTYHERSHVAAYRFAGSAHEWSQQHRRLLPLRADLLGSSCVYGMLKGEISLRSY